MCHEEESLKFALVAVVGGTRLPITIAQVRQWLLVDFAIPGDSVAIRHYHLVDFIVSFSYYDDMLWVLHNPPAAFHPRLQVLVPPTNGHSRKASLPHQGGYPRHPGPRLAPLNGPTIVGTGVRGYRALLVLGGPDRSPPLHR
jgi:hypothetical protein